MKIKDKRTAELKANDREVEENGRWNCRSTSAKPAVRQSPQQRTPQVHLAEVRDINDSSNLYTNS